LLGKPKVPYSKGLMVKERLDLAFQDMKKMNVNISKYSIIMVNFGFEGT
jgi:hypothetical protein